MTNIDSDVNVRGNLTATTMTIPSGSVVDASINPGAGVEATKLQHEHVGKTEPNGATTTAAVAQGCLHVCRGPTAQIQDFSVLVRTAAIGAATVTIDLWKNGVSILSGTYNITSGLAAYVLHSIAVTSANLVAGDVVEMAITAAAAGGGTLPKGVLGVLTVYEDPIN